MPSAKPVARPTVPPTRPPIGPPTAWPSAAPRLTLRETGSCANATAGTMEIAVTRTAAIRSFMGSSRCENRLLDSNCQGRPLFRFRKQAMCGNRSRSQRWLDSIQSPGMTTFTPHQDQALKAAADWLKARPGQPGTPQVFRLFGFAGTGKTTLARHIADAVDGEVKYAAFTGKAALVMRNKGCDDASTIHSLIYRTRESGVEQPSFELWDDAPASKARLIVIDE